MTAGRLLLTARAIADAMDGELVGGNPDAGVDGFSIDSRTLSAGDLFIAIRGERLDGHRFAVQARSRGACGVVISDPSAAVPGVDAAAGHIVIRVSDTTRALQALSREVRRESGARVVAVTGSAGKTTTKEAAAHLLAPRFDVFRNRGNLNNHIGLPLSLLELRRKPDVAVVELGMNHAGEIRTLVGLAEPDIRVWTNVSEVHTAFFESLEGIADAKAEILEGATSESVIVANAGDPLVMSRVDGAQGRVVTFGVEVHADLHASHVADRGLAGTEADVRAGNGPAETFAIPLLGRANLENVLAATAVALQFQVPLGEIAGRVRSLSAAPRRGEVHRLRGGVTLVDDSYNSNPRALKQALAVIAREAVPGRRIAVLGEMLELGARSIALHESCGRTAADAGLAALIAVGGDGARALAEAARLAGLPDVAWVKTSGEAADRAARAVRAGDLLLVKGSRGIRTDVVADRVMAEFA